MSFLAGPSWAALALLVVAGAPKVLHPYDTMRALRLAGFRVPHSVVRIFGAVEALIGLGALLSGHTVLLAAAALSFLAFAGFVAWALRRDAPLASCGCFGKADTPPTVLHLVIVAGFTLTLAGAAAGSTNIGLINQLLLSPGLTLVTAGYAAVICWLAYVAMAILPTTYARPAANSKPVTRSKPAAAQPVQAEYSSERAERVTVTKEGLRP